MIYCCVTYHCYVPVLQSSVVFLQTYSTYMNSSCMQWMLEVQIFVTLIWPWPLTWRVLYFIVLCDPVPAVWGCTPRSPRGVQAPTAGTGKCRTQLQCVIVNVKHDQHIWCCCFVAAICYNLLIRSICNSIMQCVSVSVQLSAFSPHVAAHLLFRLIECKWDAA